MTNDPGDDELRRRYVEAAVAMDDPLRAAEALKGALRRRRSAPIRERVGVDVAMLYLKDGELASARQALLDVVTMGAGGPSSLAAARTLLRLEGDADTPKVTEAALELMTRLSPDAAERHEAAGRLLSMHATTPLREARLAAAYESLVDSPRAEEALAWLRTFYRKKGNRDGLSEVYRTLAVRSNDLAEGRSHALESIRLATDQDPDKTIERWQWFVERFGPDREAHRNLAPLLERAHRHAELACVLEADALIAPPTEQAPILARWGQTLLSELGDVDAALRALRACVRVDPANAVARRALEQLMAASDRRLEAAEILEPLYASDGSPEGRLRVLETRATVLEESGGRLAALREAVDVARSAHLLDRAATLCRRAIDLDPSSPELHGWYDDLAGASEAGGDRLVRYEEALERATDAARRTSLLHATAEMRRGAGDVGGAIAAWQCILEQAPADALALERLVDAKVELGDDEAVLSLLDLARASLVGRPHIAMTVRKAVWLSDHGGGDTALELCREVIDHALSPSQLDAVVQVAREADDDILQRQALELLSRSDDAQASRRALEQLGDFQYERLGDRRAAASSWRAAAQAYVEADHEHAQGLYERAIETLPNDVGAAERLIELCASTGAWMRVLDVIWVFIRAGDTGRAAEYLLRFQDSAIEARATDEFRALADEIFARVGLQTPEWLGALRRARARALLADPGRQKEAADALRELIEAFGQPDDERAFERLVESNPSAEERHRQRRWLYQRQSAHAPDRVPVLLEWAGAELAYGDPDAARGVYERVLALDPGHGEALEALCRLRFQAGDFDGGHAALRDLCTQRGADAAVALGARVAEWLWKDLGRPGEAARVLAPWIGTDPRPPPARALAHEMLGDSAVRDETIERLEAATDGAPVSTARCVLEFLLAANEQTRELPEARQRWCERLVALWSEDPEIVLARALPGAIEAPYALALWDAAERAARRLGRPEPVARAYREALLGPGVAPALAGVLGQRLVAFEQAFSMDQAASVGALLRVLDAVPEARWALERVKLPLSAAGRWTELLDAYDRAVLAAPSERERAELLSEAAFAAMDLAGEPKRAAHCFEFLRALRPDDVAVEGALERLYGKLGLKRELIALLSRRGDRTSGFRLRELEHQIAALWLELGDTAHAHAVVERMLAGGAEVADVAAFLERIARPPAPVSPEARAAGDHAASRLQAFYRLGAQTGALAQITEAALDLADGAGARKARAREWVGVLLSAGGAPSLGAVVDRVQSRLGSDATLATVIHKTVLVGAIRAWRRTSGAGPADAEEAVHRIALALADLLVQAGRLTAATRLLHRLARLPFGRARRRELLRRAAFVCADIPGAIKRAVDLFDELFDDDASDDVAKKAMPRFAELLGAAGEDAKLAARWQELAQIRAGAGDAATACDCWERAGRIWEAHEDVDRAVAAFRQGAALASEASFEALARIHFERGEWKDAASALEWLGAHAREGDPLARALKLAGVYTKAGDGSRARASLEQVLPLADNSPQGEPIRQQLLALYRQDGIHGPLARLLAAEALRVEPLPQKLALVREACEILHSKLGEHEEATALLKLSLSWAPGDEGLRSWLIDVLGSLERWDEVAGILREQIAGFGAQRSTDRALVHQRLAGALVHANRIVEALAELRPAADMFPGHAGILYDLARIALDAGEADFAEATYRALLFASHRPAQDPASAGAPRRADVLVDLAEISLRRGDGERGVELIDSAFDDALAGGSDLDRLTKALDARGRHELLARELERCAERAPTLGQRALVLGEWVGLWERQLARSPEAAARIRLQAQRVARDLENDALTDPGPWAALCRVQQAVGDPETRDRLVARLASAAASVPGKADRGRLRASLGRLLLQSPSRDADAVATLEAALSDDADDREAEDLLSDALERQGRFEQLADILERRRSALGWEGEPRDVAAAEWRLGRAFEKAGRPKEALELYESMVESRHVDREVVAGLTERLDALGSERLADCLEVWMTLDASAAPRVAEQLLDLLEQRGDRAGAARVLEVAFSHDPSSAQLRDRLVAHHEEQGQWSQAAAALRRALEASPKDRTLLVKLLGAYQRSGARSDVVRTLDSALVARPRDAELLALRATARENAGDVDGALTDLEAACSVDTRRLGALAELLGRAASREGDPAVDAHDLRLAEVLVRLNRPSEARVALQRLRARGPRGAEALHRIALVASGAQDWGAAADAYRDLVAIDDETRTPEAVLSLASALLGAHERAGRVEEARRLLVRSLDELARDPAYAPDVERLREAVGDWKGLAELLVQRAERQPEGDEKVALLTRAARLRLEQGKDPGGALAVIERARSAAPANVELSMLRARAQVVLGRPGEALAVLGEVLARGRLPRPMLAALHLEVAKAHLSVDRIVEAWRALKSAFPADPRDGEIALMLGLLSIDLEDEATAERALMSVTTASSRVDAGTRALAFFHLARMAHDKHDTTKARLLATKAAEADPKNQAVRRLLERLAAPSSRRPSERGAQ